MRGNRAWVTGSARGPAADAQHSVARAPPGDCVRRRSGGPRGSGTLQRRSLASTKRPSAERRGRTVGEAGYVPLPFTDQARRATALAPAGTPAPARLRPGSLVADDGLQLPDLLVHGQQLELSPDLPGHFAVPEAAVRAVAGDPAGLRGPVGGRVAGGVPRAEAGLGLRGAAAPGMIRDLVARSRRLGARGRGRVYFLVVTGHGVRTA